MQEVFEFGVEDLMHMPFGLVVLGRCWDAAFGIGDVFTELRWVQYKQRGSPPQHTRVAEDISAKLQLRVDEISAYSRLIDRVYPGLTAGLRLTGSGSELLLDIDFNADSRAGKSWLLRGQRLAEPVTAAVTSATG